MKYVDLWWSDSVDPAVCVRCAGLSYKSSQLLVVSNAVLLIGLVAALGLGERFGYLVISIIAVMAWVAALRVELAYVRLLKTNREERKLARVRGYSFLLMCLILLIFLAFLVRG